jgi:hypothetical protein
MLDTPSAQRVGNVSSRSDRDPFLTSQRASAACAREFARLSDEIKDGVTTLAGVSVDEQAVIRQSPDRCIVQLGPVALTIAWLQSSRDSVAMGELLAIVWRGAVAPNHTYQPERPVKGRAPRGATSLWEEVRRPIADSEMTWAWQPHDAQLAPCSSSELALRCVERLRAAYLEYA